MEYSDLQSFERLTGRAYFTPAGYAGAIDLGNIEMLKIDYGLKSYDKITSVRGRLQLGQRDYYQSFPVFSIDGNQFATPEIALLILGRRLDDYEQTENTGNTYTFVAEAGRAFFIGAHNISGVVVTSTAPSPTTYVAGTDYFLDAFNGIIALPSTPGAIMPGDTVLVTYNQAGLVLERYEALTKLSRLGALIVFAEDEYGPPAREIWSMQVSLSCKKAADIDPSKFRKFTMEAAVLGTPLVRKRPNQQDGGGTTVTDDVTHLGVGGDTFAYE